MTRPDLFVLRQHRTSILQNKALWIGGLAAMLVLIGLPRQAWAYNVTKTVCAPTPEELKTKVDKKCPPKRVTDLGGGKTKTVTCSKGKSWGICDPDNPCGDNKYGQEIIKHVVITNQSGDVIQDPVVISTGEFVEAYLDMESPTPGNGAWVSRNYGNQREENHGFGHGWDSQLWSRISVDVNLDVELTLGDGETLEFDWNGSGYDSPSPQLTLVESSGNYTLTTQGGDQYHFSSNMVQSRVNSLGEALYWEYDGPRVTRLRVDPSGGITHVLALEWDTNIDVVTKVSDVRPNVSRSLEYLYKVDGGVVQLTKVSGTCGGCGGPTDQGYTYYAATNNIEDILDADDNIQMKLTYDDDRAITQVRAYGTSYASTATFDRSVGVITAKQFDGVTVEYHVDSNYYSTKQVVKTTVRPGESDHTTAVEYSATNRPTKGTLATNRIVLADYGVDAQVATYILDETSPITRSRYEYDSFANFGNVTRHLDADGNELRFEYNTAGLATRQIYVPTTGTATTKSLMWDDAGQLTRETDYSGVATEYYYDGAGFLVSKMLDPAGLALTDQYNVDAQGRTTKYITPDGQAWTTLYSGGNLVTKKVQPDGLTTESLYNQSGQLTRSLTYNSGTITRTTDYLRDCLGRTTRMSEPGSRHTDYLYDGTDRVTWIQRPDGVQAKTVYDEFGRTYQQLAYDGSSWITRGEFYYDGEGRITKQTDANNNFVVKNREFDAYGRLTRETDALNNYAVMHYDSLGRRTREIRYDGANSAIAEQRMAYDADNRVTRTRELSSPGGAVSSSSDRLVDYVYDVDGQLITQKDYLSGTEGSSPELKPTTFAYDNAGRNITQTSSDGPTLVSLYDSASQITKQITDPAGLVLATIYVYDELGRNTRVTNPDGTYTVTLYDGLGRVTKTEQYASGGTKFAVVETLYDNNLNVATKTYRYASPTTQSNYNATTDPSTASLYTATGRLTATVDPNGNATTYDYDGLGRQITVTDAASNKQIVLYDNADRALTQKRLDYDGTNHITFTTAMAYDGRNQITMVVDTNNSLTHKTFYDALGQVTQTQDPAGMKVATYFDRLGRVTRTTEDVDGIARYTDRLYDRAGRLTRLIGYTADATGAQNTDYAYNKAGVLTRSTYPDDTSGGGGDRGYIEHFYDAVLRLTKVTDQEAQDTVIVYDSMSRRTAITKGTEVDTFAYNTAGQVTLARRGTSGNPDAVSQSERFYDGLLRLTREAQSVKEIAARNVDYAYDDAGNVLTLTYPNGAVIATSYTANNLRNVISRGGSQLADYDYVGYRPKSLTYETGANDVVLTNSYDAGARLTRMAYAQSGNATLPDFSYSFDAASNITRKKFEHRSGTPSEDYLYDTLARLTRTDFGQRASTPYEGFIYDDLGNHLTQDNNGTTVAGLFNSANEQTKRGATQVYYDKNGNLTKDDTVQVYFYDRQNLLTRVEDGSSNRIASYAYDAFNRRIEKDVENGATDTITRFYYTADWRLLEETDDAGTPAVQRYYVWGNYIDELLMFRDVIGTGGTANADYFACRHHNYNIVTLLNSTGAVVERYDYNPYGERIVLNTDYTEDASGGDGLSDFGLTIGHQGLMHDDESRLVYNSARMRDPKTGRWLQREPSGYVDGLNRYEYLRSNTTMFVDPSGRWATDEFRLPIIGDLIGGAVEVGAGVIGGAGKVIGGVVDGAGKIIDGAGKALLGDTSCCKEEGLKKAREALGRYPFERALQNDMKYMHCLNACYVQKECGLLSLPLVTLGGVYHEIETGPIPLPPVSSIGTPGGHRFDGQPILDWIYDTPGDLIANTIGQIGALVPANSCEAACGASGLIPGPNHGPWRDELNRTGQWPTVNPLDPPSSIGVSW